MESIIWNCIYNRHCENIYEYPYTSRHAWTICVFLSVLEEHVCMEARLCALCVQACVWGMFQVEIRFWWRILRVGAGSCIVRSFFLMKDSIRERDPHCIIVQRSLCAGDVLLFIFRWKFFNSSRLMYGTVCVSCFKAFIAAYSSRKFWVDSKQSIWHTLWCTSL